jgi:hypothetical protein
MSKAKTKTKPRDEDEDLKEMISWRIRGSLLERIRVVKDGLPSIQPGTKASEASIVESILLGDTTLSELERRVAKG